MDHGCLTLAGGLQHPAHGSVETASERGKYVSQDPLPPLNFEPSFEECAMECNYSAEPMTEETDFNGMNQLVLCKQTVRALEPGVTC